MAWGNIPYTDKAYGGGGVGAGGMHDQTTNTFETHHLFDRTRLRQSE